MESFVDPNDCFYHYFLIHQGVARILFQKSSSHGIPRRSSSAGLVNAPGGLSSIYHGFIQNRSKGILERIQQNTWSKNAGGTSLHWTQAAEGRSYDTGVSKNPFSIADFIEDSVRFHLDFAVVCMDANEALLLENRDLKVTEMVTDKDMVLYLIMESVNRKYKSSFQQLEILEESPMTKMMKRKQMCQASSSMWPINTLMLLHLTMATSR